MQHHSMLFYLQLPRNISLEQGVHEQKQHRYDVKVHSKIKKGEMYYSSIEFDQLWIQNRPQRRNHSNLKCEASTL